MASERSESVATSATSSTALSITSSKPIKLRNACNQCFAAKVRCNGNKSGCHRCLERKLPCKYSESRVGKVVGRRRKRPLEDAVGTVHSSEWVIANYTPSTAMPSPANTSMSDESTKSSSIHQTWMPCMDSNDQADFVTVTHGDASPEQTADPYSFLDRKASLAGSTGLPTPALSPPQYAYLSPMMLENTIGPAATMTVDTTSRFLAPAMPIPVCRTPQPQQADDEEMVCIKLLGHLKKSSAKDNQSLDDHLSLIKKSNAAIRRILKSKKARSDYACVMLLSNIMLRVVELCEKVSQSHLEEPENGDTHFLSAFTDNFFNDSEQAYFNADVQVESFKPDRAVTLHGILMQVVDLVSSIGSLLKRKPLNGFQSLGKHESLHVELEQRLHSSLALLS